MEKYFYKIHNLRKEYVVAEEADALQLVRYDDVQLGLASEVGKCSADERNLVFEDLKEKDK